MATSQTIDEKANGAGTAAAAATRRTIATIDYRPQSGRSTTSRTRALRSSARRSLARTCGPWSKLRGGCRPVARRSLASARDR